MSDIATPATDIPLAPQFHTMEPTKVPKDATPYFIVGTDDRPQDTRIVAVVISVRAEIKMGDRDFSASIPLHEVHILRKYYDLRGGGTLRVSPGWPPALSRHRQLTQESLKLEAERLARYIVPRLNMPPMQPFADIFGPSPDVQLRRLHEVMRLQIQDWNGLMKSKRAEVLAQKALNMADPRQAMMLDSYAAELINEKSLEEIINRANPEMRGIDGIDLPLAPIFEEGATAGSSATVDRVALGKIAAEGEDALDDLAHKRETLLGLGVAEAVITRLLDALETAGKVEKLTDASLASILGSAAAVPKVRAALKVG